MAAPSTSAIVRSSGKKSRDSKFLTRNLVTAQETIAQESVLTMPYILLSRKWMKWSQRISTNVHPDAMGREPLILKAFADIDALWAIKRLESLPAKK
jgi:hypothetical protein